MAVVNASTIEVNTFGFGLLSKLVTESPGQSIAISPFSLAHCLILAAMRSGPHDAQIIYRLLNCHWFTVEQIESWFSQRNQQYLESACIDMAAACWADYEFPSEPDIEIRQECLGASEQSLDYRDGVKAAKIVNEWVAVATKGHIKNIVMAQDFANPEFQVLTAALYFKASWQQCFAKEDTSYRFFKPSLFQFRLVETMHLKSPHIDYSESAYFRAVRLPLHADRLSLHSGHINETYSMNIILPKANLSISDTITHLTDSFPDGVEFPERTNIDYEVVIKLPKFKIETIFNNIKHLTNNHFGILKRIGNIAHHSIIEIDEEGVEAVSASAVGGNLIAPLNPPKPEDPKVIKFYAQRPFIWTITDDSSGAMLFAGVVANP